MRVRLEEIVESIGKGKRLTRGNVRVESFDHGDGLGLILYQGPDGRTAGIYSAPNYSADDKTRLMRLLAQSKVKDYDPAHFERYSAQGTTLEFPDGASLHMNVSRDLMATYQVSDALGKNQERLWGCVYSAGTLVLLQNAINAYQAGSELLGVVNLAAAAALAIGAARSFLGSASKQVTSIGNIWESLLDAQEEMRTAEQNNDTKRMRKIATRVEESAQYLIESVKDAAETQRCGTPGAYVFKSGTRQEVLGWYETFLAPIRGAKPAISVADRGYTEPQCAYCTQDINPDDPVNLTEMENGIRRPLHTPCAAEYKGSSKKGTKVRE